MRLHTIPLEGDYPDVGNAELPCCIGSAEYGPGRCTCWRPEYDQPQAPPASGPRPVRARMCSDCAFRPDSPERNHDPRYAHSDEDSFEAMLDGVFVCHQGLRRIVRQHHPKGAAVDAPPCAYAPAEPPCKADGSPAEYCAGWAAEQQRRGEYSAD